MNNKNFSINRRKALGAGVVGLAAATISNSAILWLASDDASFVTGEVMKVDGYFLPG